MVKSKWRTHKWNQTWFNFHRTVERCMYVLISTDIFDGGNYGQIRPKNTCDRFYSRYLGTNGTKRHYEHTPERISIHLCRSCCLIHLLRSLLVYLSFHQQASRLRRVYKLTTRQPRSSRSMVAQGTTRVYLPLWNSITFYHHQRLYYTWSKDVKGC